MSTKKVTIQVARLVREVRTVVVEVHGEDDMQLKALLEDLDLSEVYEEVDDDGWESDSNWGCEEGTHAVLATDTGLGEPSTLVMTTDGVVSRK